MLTDDAGRNGTASHESRRQFLDSLAVLIGCHEQLGATLPDGLRPDVLRISTARRLLFLGEAKHSESPRNRYTVERLRSYVRWIGSHLDYAGEDDGPPPSAVMAICFGTASDADDWLDTLRSTLMRGGVLPTYSAIEEFDYDVVVAWCACAHPDHVAD